MNTNSSRSTSFALLMTLLALLQGSFIFAQSELASGTIYKIGVSHTGIHAIGYDFLQNELGMDMEALQPQQIRLLGAGGGMLPEVIAETTIDDLVEIPIWVEGEADGTFDADDRILFFAEGPDKWYFDEDNRQFRFEKNIYDTQNYYFIKIDGTPGMRISTQASLSDTDYTTTSYDAHIRYEDDRINLLHDFGLGQGSGKDWYGDLFEVVRERTYEGFDFPNIVTTTPARVKAAFAGRSSANSRFRVLLNNQSFQSNLIASVNTGHAESTYARVVTIDETFMPTTPSLPVTIRYDENGTSSSGWLDYIEVHARQQLRMQGDQIQFRDTKTLEYERSTFVLEHTTSNIAVWDITDPLLPMQQEVTSTQSGLQFGLSTQVLRELVAFDTTADYPLPTAVGEIPNQNIHAINDVDMVVVYPEAFAAEAAQFAEHRSTFSDLDIALVLVTDIYNEFSSGRLDPSAIRNFAKMLYDRNPSFKYLLLFGDGSFDARGIYSFEQRSDYIPVYETDQTLAPIEAFPSDDYYALLDDNEGQNLGGDLDIAVGRFPVKTNAEAQRVVDKIIRYDTNPTMLGDWQNRCVFVADDEDTNRHLIDADGIATKVENNYRPINMDKIYFDAYPQISTPGGEKYPAVTEAINNTMFKGALIINYLGHGGSKGWAQERVIGLEDIDSWSNDMHFPLLITATCSFAGYDDPAFTTAGERTLLSSTGGVIGLFTTVRAVYANSNEALTQAVFNQVFERDSLGQFLSIGEILRRGKNTGLGNTSFQRNSRKFTLLGDPSMHLAIPEYHVATLRINGNPVGQGTQDTLSALEEVTIRGQIEDNEGNLLSDFNGTVYPSIFDKAITVTTLGQDPDSSPRSFQLQKNILFKGAASVQNGQFEFSFVMPKDINYNFGNGKISYFAKDEGLRDASGSFEDFIIGGTNTDAEDDNEGPIVEVFMNNEDFVFGGITDENPVLYVKLQDDTGINVSGSSVGHDLTAVLDENTQNEYLLNDFYEASTDDYTRGVVRYPLYDIPEGRHQIRVKAWDVANNSAEGMTEFVVVPSANVSLQNIFNYPNPFSEFTNFSFEHNIDAPELDVEIQIYTASGQYVTTLVERFSNNGYRINDLQWDGRDDFGNEIARGLYVYKIKVRANREGKAIESKLQKLVYIKN